MVVTEYIGDASHSGLGVREAFLLAGEEAANTDNHGVISGTVPPGATLTLRKQFESPTFSQPALNVDETLETTLQGPASGSYEWHVMPSDRPEVSGGPPPDPGDEVWTMTCQRPGGSLFTTTVNVARGEAVTVDWGAACGADAPGNLPPVADFSVFPAAPEAGQQVNLTSASADPDGAIQATNWDLDDDGAFDDAGGLVATVTFATPGPRDVAVEVTDNEGATDTEVKTITVAAASNAAPAAAFDFTPSNPAAGQNVVFSSTSTDADGSVTALEWDFDADGQFDDGSGGQVTRSFAADGTYPVTLRATDDGGRRRHGDAQRPGRAGAGAGAGRHLPRSPGDPGRDERRRSADGHARRRRDRRPGWPRPDPRPRRRRPDLRRQGRRPPQRRAGQRRAARQQGPRPAGRRPGHRRLRRGPRPQPQALLPVARLRVGQSRTRP